MSFAISASFSTGYFGGYGGYFPACGYYAPLAYSYACLPFYYCAPAFSFCNWPYYRPWQSFAYWGCYPRHRGFGWFC